MDGRSLIGKHGVLFGIKSSHGDFRQAPAFLFERQRGANDPAVVQIP